MTNFLWGMAVGTWLIVGAWAYDNKSNDSLPVDTDAPILTPEVKSCRIEKLEVTGNYEMGVTAA